MNMVGQYGYNVYRLFVRHNGCTLHFQKPPRFLKYVSSALLCPLMISIQCQRNVSCNEFEVLVPCVQLKVIVNCMLCDHQVRNSDLVDAMF